jgi:glycerol-3-phosphate dehydrogenase
VPPPGSRVASCALYADATTNDTRLCLANVRAAEDAGVRVLNGAEVVALRSQAAAS